MTQAVPKSLLQKLMCPVKKNSGLIHDIDQNLLTTTDPSIAYNVYKGIPDMVTVNDGPAEQDWNLWDSEDFHKMGDSYYKRAKVNYQKKRHLKVMHGYLKIKIFINKVIIY